MNSKVDVGGAQYPAPTLGASMDADLDLLLIAVFCTADDLLPTRPENARRILTDAEVVTLCRPAAAGDQLRRAVLGDGPQAAGTPVPHVAPAPGVRQAPASVCRTRSRR
jgi:hypothetical protein